MAGRARDGLEVGVGLTLLGVQRWMSMRPDIERELDRLGYGLAAELSRQVGDGVTRAMTKLISEMASSPGAR